MSENLTYCFSTFLLDPPCLTSEVFFHVLLVNETPGHSYKQQGRPGLEEHLNVCLSPFLRSSYCRCEYTEIALQRWEKARSIDTTYNIFF